MKNILTDFLHLISLESTSSFIVIGVDPGSKKLGYSVLLFQKGIFSLIKIGSIRLSGTLGEKLAFFYSFFSSLYDSLLLEFSLSIFFSTEGQFSHLNIRSSFVLVSFTAVLLLLSQLKNASFFEFSPSEARSRVFGSSKLSKEQVAVFFQDFFFVTFSSLDESDSLAIAFAGALKILGYG